MAEKAEPQDNNAENEPKFEIFRAGNFVRMILIEEYEPNEVHFKDLLESLTESSKDKSLKEFLASFLLSIPSRLRKLQCLLILFLKFHGAAST